MFTELAVLAIVSALVAWFIWARARRRRHAPIEFYLGWDGYQHPISLHKRITREEAEAVAAEGHAYLIGHFDSDGRLRRVVKMLRGSVFFDFEYTYYPNGTRKSAKVTNAKGVVTMGNTIGGVVDGPGRRHSGESLCDNWIRWPCPKPMSRSTIAQRSRSQSNTL